MNQRADVLAELRGWALPRLREWRRARLLTQQELSTKAGVGRDTINAIERGHQGARGDTIRKLAEALGVDPAELLAPPEPAP